MNIRFRLFFFLPVFFLLSTKSFAQVKWVNVDSLYAPLPASVQVFKTTDSLDGKPFIAYYVRARLKDMKLDFTVDTTLGRRLTPSKFYEKNNQPLIVVNCTFFNFDKNQNLNMVIKNGKLVGYNIHSLPMRGKDTFQYRHPLASAIGIDKKRNADIVWTLTDSSKRFAYAKQSLHLEFTACLKDWILHPSFNYIRNMNLVLLLVTF
ncbi:MAG: hypothetical protein IPP96_12725 [Chitinophagaceae bacterium]|nr:hypothetical protein [Chitinophagaceae bacterium]